MVVVVSVDEKDAPRFAQVHFVEGDEMRDRFDRAYAARGAAGYTMPVGRSIWLSMYDLEAKNPLVGAGVGLDNPAVGRIPLSSIKPSVRSGLAEPVWDTLTAAGPTWEKFAPHKRQARKTLGADPRGRGDATH